MRKEKRGVMNRQDTSKKKGLEGKDGYERKTEKRKRLRRGKLGHAQDV